MLAQANRLDNGELVQGYYIYIEEDYQHTIGVERDNDVYVVDPKTLKYSFDGGESFHSESEIQNALGLKELKIFKELNNDN